MRRELEVELEKDLVKRSLREKGTVVWIEIWAKEELRLDNMRVRGLSPPSAWIRRLCILSVSEPTTPHTRAGGRLYSNLKVNKSAGQGRRSTYTVFLLQGVASAFRFEVTSGKVRMKHGCAAARSQNFKLWRPTIPLRGMRDVAFAATAAGYASSLLGASSEHTRTGLTRQPAAASALYLHVERERERASIRLRHSVFRVEVGPASPP